MATLIYLALRAYHHSKWKSSIASPIARTNSIASSSNSFTASPPSFGDDAEYECLFQDDDTMSTTSEQDLLHVYQITDRQNSLQEPRITFSNLKSFQHKDEIVVGSGKIICTQTANTTTEKNSSPSTAERQRDISSPNIKFCIPRFHGEDDVLILYSNEGLFITRIPVSAIHVSVLREWTDNIINSITLLSVSSKTGIRAVPPLFCSRNIFDGEDQSSPLYRGYLILSNKNASTNTTFVTGPRGMESDYTVSRGLYISLRELFDAYFEYKYRGYLIDGASQINTGQESDLEIIFSPRENMGKIRIYLRYSSGITEIIQSD